MKATFGPARRFGGAMRPPSDKSLTHRAYVFASLAIGSSAIRNPLRGEDCENTREALERMGMEALESDEVMRVTPAAAWSSPDLPLDCGNSGTTARLLSGVIAARPIRATLVGDASLSRRPMRRVAEPLVLMGADIRGDTLPLEIQGTDLRGIEWTSPVASAQVKSAVLLAGLRAQGTTTVREPALSRDHTERMLRALGAPLESGSDATGHWVRVRSGSLFPGFEVSIPGDLSSAAFAMVAAAMIPGGDLTLREVGVNPTRTGILDVLRRVGARVEIGDEREALGEPVADVRVRSGGLVAFEIGGGEVPRLIDEIPILAVLATRCEGTSVIRDATELRAKESDRVETIAAALRLMGAAVETFPDGLAITGPTPLAGATIEAHGDHRIAMAVATAALVAEGETEIEGWEAVRTSYPKFQEEMAILSRV